MSGAGVQRAIVRMMFDPGFRDLVYADPAAALTGCEITDEERGWLVRPDRRAYATDGTRRARALCAIEEELPAAIAWARGEGRAMEDFFAAAELHGCIEERGVLTLAFAAWLRRDASAALATLVDLEAAVARARRGVDVRDADDGQVVRSARAILVETREGVLAWWDAVRVAAMTGEPLPPPTSGEPCVALVQVDRAGHARAEELPAGLDALLAAAAQPIARTALEAVGVQLGLDVDEACVVVDELLADGLLLSA